MWHHGGVKPLAYMLLAAGGIAVLAGVILLLADRIPFLGKLPGDVRIEGRHGTFYFPVVTCLAISVVLTVVANLVARWFRH